MRIQVIILSLALSVFSHLALAGSGHDHGHSHSPVTQSQAEVVATKSIVRLVNTGNLDKSWTTVKAISSEKKNFGGNMEWVVSFKNEMIKDPEQQILYIFLTLGGQYLAANYTGK